MAKPRPKRVMFDTNVSIVGALDRQSAERQVLNWLAAQTDVIVLMSQELSDQILRVGKRVGGKDWAGWVHYMTWRNYTIEFVEISQGVKELIEQSTDIPREDIAIFLTALVGKADCFISANHELVKKAAAIQDAFECLTADEFYRKYVV